MQNKNTLIPRVYLASCGFKAIVVQVENITPRIATLVQVLKINSKCCTRLNPSLIEL